MYLSEHKISIPLLQFFLIPIKLSQEFLREVSFNFIPFKTNNIIFISADVAFNDHGELMPKIILKVAPTVTGRLSITF